MRSPKYLDVALLQELAEFYEIEYPVEEVVVERGGSSRKAGVSVGPAALNANAGVAQQRDTQRTFTVPSNPVRALNLVLDHLEAAPGSIAAVGDDLAKGDLMRTEGPLSIAPASEVGSLLQNLGPQLASAIPDPAQVALFTQLFGFDQESSPKRLLRLTSAMPMVLVSLEDEHFFRNSSLDDVVDDVEVLGFVEKVLADGDELPVENWILPGATRTARRALTGEAIEQLVERLRPLLGEDVLDYKLRGPAILLRAVAIF